MLLIQKFSKLNKLHNAQSTMSILIINKKILILFINIHKM